MNKSKISDQDLLKSFFEGKEDALSSLLEKHQKRVYNYILILVKDSDTANDILQETLIKALNSLRSGKYSDTGKFSSWILRIAHNQVIDHFRQVKSNMKTTTNNDDLSYDIFNNHKLSDSSIEDTIIAEQIASDVRKLIDHLPAEQREIVLLRHYNNMSFKEISEHLDISISTALGRMRYALINLRKLIAEKGVILTS